MQRRAAPAGRAAGPAKAPRTPPTRPPSAPSTDLPGRDAGREPPAADRVPDEEGEAVGEDQDRRAAATIRHAALPDRVEHPQRGDRPAEGAEVDRAEQRRRRRARPTRSRPRAHSVKVSSSSAPSGAQGHAQPAGRRRRRGRARRPAAKPTRAHGADARARAASAKNSREAHARAPAATIATREPGRAEEERREERRAAPRAPSPTRRARFGAKPGARSPRGGSAIRPGRFRRSAAHASGSPGWPAAGAGAGSRATARR